jgi:hypothetical protein
MLYEINTRCWLRELSETAGEPITLANIPESEFSKWRRLGFTHIWLMGVWTGGPRARAQALNPELRVLYATILPDWQEQDVGGSPYAIAEYRVPAALGEEPGLTGFRKKLNAQGLKLILDFVPNHLGLDHRWINERPQLFVQSASEHPETFAQQTAAGERWLAHGKDPNSGAWTDTVQLDYRREDTQAAMLQLLESVATRCDGVRCDMSMLLLADVFARTWQRFPAVGDQTKAEFWGRAIAKVKEDYPDFMFLAEAYWGVEPRLHDLGFDFTYDKELYDHLIARQPGEVRRHLFSHTSEFLKRSAHFLENHDESRIASLLSPTEHRAAALLVLGLPGLRFLHEGQLRGARFRTPVQLQRRPREPVQAAVKTMYQELLEVLPSTYVGKGRWQLCPTRPAWAGNPTADNFVIVHWQSQAPEFDLVVVNLAPHRSQCYTALPALAVSVPEWVMKDRLGKEKYQRSSDDLRNNGLYLDLAEHGAQLFHFRPQG